MRDDYERDLLRRLTASLVGEAANVLGTSDDWVRGFIGDAPYSSADVDGHRVFSQIGRIADELTGRRSYPKSTVDAFYERARIGQPGEASFVGGHEALRMHRYPDGVVESLPARAVAGFLGLGNVWTGIDVAAARSVLDVGCGAGVDLAVAANHCEPGTRLAGIDKRGDLLGIAQLACPQAEFRIDDVGSLTGGWSEFDVVVANGLPPLQRPQTLLETVSTLISLVRSGGCLSATILTASQGLVEQLSHWYSWKVAAGLAMLITAKPAVEHVVTAVDRCGAVVTTNVGMNPYRDEAMRETSALYQFIGLVR